MRFPWSAPGKDTGWSWQSNRGLVAIPIAFIVVITVADVLAPQEVHLGPLLVVAPALTASFGSSRLTALIGILATAALFTIAAVRNSITTSNHESQLASLIVISAFTVFFCRLRERHSAELRQVRSVAEAAQRVVLQPLPPRIGPLSVAFRYEAAADQARIGGDLYAAVRTRHGTRLLIGDVRGKGLTAVDDADLLLGAFRSAAHRELPLRALQSELEAVVSWGLARPSRQGPDAAESFITAALIDVPDREAHISVLNSGHPAPLRLHDGRVSTLSPRQYAPPIGVLQPRVSCAEPDVFAFEPGDTLLLYTDGVTEARDGDGRFYPLADRLPLLVDGEVRPVDLLGVLREDLLHYTAGSLGDDAAMVAVRHDLPGDFPAPEPERAPARCKVAEHRRPPA
ncbi:PP2C family protein-serine/threonine phosphatase [Actinacidiphila bryophytorum]|uniref:Serine phosphatase RsbU, regulator of sigma subunit n=1 Tax=Actinacidiphila bryophytorum TaxID=1436133 RepID=A0A9W4H3H5_9ACTN|nr:PP2C family protein-serine/threonine phosphatase [Actinacidiphila bryophytorum]MBM9439870.1 serine/threonine-protein phosphatase [Actinacidiphila bryophytorum]MBN6542788.1 serine/threonine-protein phosphatase [Actinacidiphila bryophytorum]CAG7648301.1 Serine phosphatase RsbU, regulator of sigma subunit [Actinacidiphila bryophytorum]